MKVCPNCGAQYDDAINFCSACGTATVASAPVVVEAPVVAPAAPEKKSNPIFGFIGKILSILSAMFIGCGIAGSYIDVNVYVGSYSVNGYGYFEPDETCSVFAFLLAMGALAMAVISFIQTLIKKGGIEKIFAAIVQMTLAMAAMIVSIVMMANM
ncbi:MAG: zinc ribbon domain-containing protein [Clostridia bacterium]|nr:zinc ribbon domain-containing protein [Clostridia bacterium]